MRYIETLKDGERISEVYLCKSKSIALTKTGKEYANVMLADKTGQIDSKIWDLNSGGIAEFDVNDYVAVTGQVTSYNGALQFKIERARIASESEYVAADYVPSSRFNIDDMFAELMKYVDSVKSTYMKQLLYSFFKDEAFAKRAHEATLKLQSGDKACRAIWKHIMNVSKKDLKKNYDNLNVSFDLWKGESDAQPYIDEMVDKMIADGIAYESQGATVVDIAEETDTKELPPCIVRKSDGAALYATSDLATIVEREKLYKPDTYIYLADKRQELHFTQVFRTAKKAGIVRPDVNMTFVGFGTMNGKDGKPFKTRSGGVMRLEHLIADIDNAVLNKIKENRSVSEEEAQETSKIVGLAALKYGDLSNQASKDYVFDIDRFASFEGNTGPYILYTIVRIKSILAKYKENGGSLDDIKILPAKEESEKTLSLSLVKFQEVIESAYKDNAPHRICQYIYEVSNAFNGFYHNTKILAEENEEQKKSYIALITLTKGILEACTDLLGIKCPDRM